MGFGTFGSTLNDELNRLANGGTYRDMNQMVDDALAAKQWANRENIVPYTTDTVGVLNEIAALGPNRQNWFDFNGVCNYLAGTTGLPAAAALRQITTTGDILTSLAAFYVDALYPTGLTSTPGYVYLNGVTGNYMSTPDASVLDITGDIDIRAQVALDDWTPTADSTIISKWNTGNISYAFNVNTTGVLGLYVSSNGTVVLSATSTVATGINDGATSWIRVTRASVSGSVIFYTSTDGSTWTQLGTTIAGASGSLFSGTALLEVGRLGTGFNATSGKIYRAQILSGINGTTVFDANMANVSLAATSFTESSTNAATVTINGFRAVPQTIDNLGNGGALLPVTVGSSTAADSNDPKFLDHTGVNYAYLPGVASNVISIPDTAELDITGDIDLRASVAMDDWTPSALQILVSKRGGSGSNISYQLYIDTTGNIGIGWSSSGTLLALATSTVAPTVADGASLWVRATLDVDNGVSGWDAKFFTSPNGTTWTQLGATVTQAGVTSIFSGTSAVELGGRTSGSASLLAGKIYRAQILNGIGGTTVLDVDTSVITTGSATSFTALTGQTVSIQRSTAGRKTTVVTHPVWLFGTDDFMEVNNRFLERTDANYLYLPGVASNYASAPDSAALDITGDIDLRVRVALDDYTPSSLNYLLSKYQSGPQASYQLAVLTDGKLRLAYSTDGTAIIVNDSSIATGLTDGTVKWLRVTRVASTGLTQFFLSNDGITYTQLGTNISGAAGNIFASTSILEIGSVLGGSTFPARGKFFRAQVLNGIGGTVAFDANFENSITSLNQATFTESSSNAATVTINRSGSAFRSAGVTDAGYLYPGATNTFSNSTLDYLNFGANQDFTVLAVTRTFGVQPAGVARGIITKGTYGVGNSWSLVGTASSGLQGNINSDLGYLYSNTGAYGFATLTMTRSGSTITTYRDTVSLGVAASSGTLSSSLSSVNTVRIGQNSGFFLDAELYGAAVFRSVLTPVQIRQITNYFANREAYL